MSKDGTWSSPKGRTRTLERRNLPTKSLYEGFKKGPRAPLRDGMKKWSVTYRYRPFDDDTKGWKTSTKTQIARTAEDATRATMTFLSQTRRFEATHVKTVFKTDEASLIIGNRPTAVVTQDQYDQRNQENRRLAKELGDSTEARLRELGLSSPYE